MHLMPEHGMSVHEIEKDGFKVDYKIYMSFSGLNHYTHLVTWYIFKLSIRHSFI